MQFNNTGGNYMLIKNQLFGNPIYREEDLQSKDFKFSKDKDYPGDQGKIIRYVLCLPVASCPNKNDFVRNIDIKIIDSELARKILTCRLIAGKEAREIYHDYCSTITKLIGNNSLFGSINRDKQVLQMLILRSGKEMKICDSMENVRTVEIECKRLFKSDNQYHFEAKIIDEPDNRIFYDNEKIVIIDDSCLASGSTYEEIFLRWANPNLPHNSTIIINVATCSLFGLLRAASNLRQDIKLSVIASCGLFSLYRKDIKLNDTEIIKAGTIINANPNNDDLENLTISSKGVSDFLLDAYRYGYHHDLPMDDIIGEAGEKFDDDQMEALLYDLQTGYVLGHMWKAQIWQSKLTRVLANKALMDRLKKLNTDAWQAYKEMYKF